MSNPSAPENEAAQIDGPARGAAAILLCTYNGAGFLEEQLASIAGQSYANWVLYASDDGSTDATLPLLMAFQDRLGAHRVIIRCGPGKGFSANFLSLVREVSASYDFYAFCDQDDVWHPDKLQKSVAWLGQQMTVPALHCGRTRLIDEKGAPLGFSPLFNKEPSFDNALMQNIAGGNTMAINRYAYQLLKKTPLNAPLVCHDWWAYLMVAGCGGVVCYSPTPTLDYRQHTHNVIGANTTLVSRLMRLRGMLKGKLTTWNDENLASLQMVNTELTPEARLSLERFAALRHSTLIKRLWLLLISGFYRQTFLGNCGLLLAVLIKRI